MRLSGTKTNSIHQYRGLGDQLWDLGGTRPSLDLQFSRTKSLIDQVSGQSLITFTRASSGTFVGSNGVLQTATNDVPRFDHNPTTGESLGLLVEEQRTNLLVQSNGFDTTWTNTNSTETAASGTAPDGTNTAWQLRDTVDASTVVHSLNQTVTFTAATAYTFSVWGKAGTLDRMALIFPAALFTNATARSCSILLSTGVVSTGGSPTSASAVQFPNGWWRVSITATVDNGVAAAVSIRTAIAGGSTYQGDGNGTILVWGAQLEAAAFPTSYIPTTTAAATRSADVASITGTNFSSWYRQDEGTVFAETQLPAGTAVNTSSRSIIDATDGSTNNRVNLRAIASAANTDQLTIRSGAVTVAQFASTGTNISTTARKIAAVYRLDDYASWATGAVTAATDTSGAVPVGVNQITVGSAVGGSEFMTGTIRRLTYWPARLANSTLQDITR